MKMETLKNVDQMDYIRFATVYMDFKKIDDFRNLINNLEKSFQRTKSPRR